MNHSAKSYRYLFQEIAGRLRNPRAAAPGAAELSLEDVRVDLFAAIERVLATQPPSVTAEELRPQLHTAIDSALGAPSAPTLQSADHKLSQAVQSVFGSPKSGQAAGTTSNAAQRVIRQVTPILLQFANDDKRLAQLEKSLVKLLSSRMGEKSSTRVAGAAVTAVRAVAKNAGKR